MEPRRIFTIRQLAKAQVQITVSLGQYFLRMDYTPIRFGYLLWRDLCLIGTGTV